MMTYAHLMMPCAADNRCMHALCTGTPSPTDSQPMMAPQEAVYIIVTHDAKTGATVSYQAEGSQGDQYSEASCCAQAVQRSRVLQELVAASEGTTCTRKLLIRPDMFSAWHDFEANETSPELQDVCDVLQVCEAQCAAQC